MARNKNLDEVIETEVTEQIEKPKKLTKPFYRVKDVDGNQADYKTLEEMASDMEINKGVLKRTIQTGKLLCGLKIYVVK